MCVGGEFVAGKEIERVDLDARAVITMQVGEADQRVMRIDHEPVC